MQLVVLPHVLAVCRFSPNREIPAWTWASKSFLSITYTEDELSVVCLNTLVPGDVQCERGWRALKVLGPLDFALTGILSSLSTPLNEHGIAIFAVSTFDTDYLLVKQEKLSHARAVLEQQGHRFPV